MSAKIEPKTFTPSPEFPIRRVTEATTSKSRLQFVQLGETAENPVEISSSQEEQASFPEAPLSPELRPSKKLFASLPHKPIPQISSSPELFIEKRKKEVPPTASVKLLAPDQRNYDSVKTGEHNWGPSTPEIVKALKITEGTIDYRNGIYEGQLKELQPHGKGVWQGKDGSYYEGDWVLGEYHGQGSFRDARDNFYNGGWKEGKRDGEGVYLFRNGDSYQGEWREGKMHGKGEARYASTGDLYRGCWKDNQRHGQGTSLIACNKAGFHGKYISFEGEYRQNMRHGTFTITTAQGSQCELKFTYNKPVPGSSRLIKISQEGSAQYSLDQWVKKPQ